MSVSEPSGSKVCGRCRRRKNDSNFHRQSSSPDGLQAWCRECMLEAKRLRRQRTRQPVPLTGPDEKWCRSCVTIKPRTAFGPQAATSDGLQVYCKACFASRYRRRRDAEGLLSRPAEIPVDHKFCRSCRQVLPLSDWARRQKSTDGYDSRCRSCATARNRAYHIARTYGMTVEEVDALVEAQGGACAICQVADAIHIDHDHTTGRVRGVLCFRCNAALGQFDEQPSYLLRAVSYLGRGGRYSRVEVRWTERLAEMEYGPAS